MLLIYSSRWYSNIVGCVVSPWYPHNGANAQSYVHTQRLATVTFGYFRVQIIQYEICHSHPHPYFVCMVVYDEYGNFPSLSRFYRCFHKLESAIHLYSCNIYNICILYVYIYIDHIMYMLYFYIHTDYKDVLVMICIYIYIHIIILMIDIFSGFTLW